MLFVPSLASNLLSVYPMSHIGSPKGVIFGPDLAKIIDISTGNIIEKGVANHASKAYEFSLFMPPSETVHSQQPLIREGKNIPSTYFAVSTCIIELAVSIYEIDIQGDSNQIPTSKRKLGR